MNRRDFTAGSTSLGLLAGGAPGWLCAARAQQQNVPVIGLLDLWGRLSGEVGRGLGKNKIEVEYGRHQDPAKSTVEFIKRQVALILAFSTRSALAAKAVTSTTPIIFLADDPVAAGLVDSLSRPGANLTGATCLVSGLTAKRIEIVRELVPTADFVVLVSNPTNKPAHDVEIREAQAAASALGLQLSIIAWTGEHNIEIELAALPRDRKIVLVFGWGPAFRLGRAPVAYLAQRYGIAATISGERKSVDQGGLISFGPRFADGGYLMGGYAARVLNGDKPADLPVQQITRTELVINLWGAKSFGLQIPSTLLARADEVIK